MNPALPKHSIIKYSCTKSIMKKNKSKKERGRAG